MKPKKLVYISKYLELPTKKYFGGRGYHLIKLMSDFETHIITSNSNHLTDVSNDLQEKIYLLSRLTLLILLNHFQE